MILRSSIEGFEMYVVDTSGRVYTLHYNKYLKPSINRHGYCRVGLRRNGKTCYVNVARLVGKAFIPNPDDKPQINHKDGNKANNAKSNLEWVTNSENLLHAYRTGLKKPYNKKY